MWEREDDARESRKTAFCGEPLDPTAQPSDWLTWEQLSACLAANGVDVSERQLERWRNEGVFPPVCQVQLKYQGSVTYFPPGSCEQALEVRKLLGENRKFEYVGWELWWGGFWAGEKHWKPALQNKALQLDGHLKRLKLQVDKDENSNSKKSLFDQAASRVDKSNSSNIIMSRVLARVELGKLATVFRVILGTATGKFDEFEPVTKDIRTENEISAGIKEKSPDETQLVKAMDLGQSEKDSILGQRFHFTRALLPALRDISTAMRTGKLVDVIQYPEEEIKNARDDVRNALSIALALHEATEWIYGREAFGLRLGAWIAKKAAPGVKRALVLVWVKYRRASSIPYSSAEIASFLDQAEIIRNQSLQLRKLAKNDQRFASVLTIKKLRQACRDQNSLNKFIKELQAATKG